MRPRTLALVLAGGAGGRLELLTDHRAKPAVPYGGTHRLVDVSLSCCAHAGLSDVWVLQQQHPASLSSHIANGRPWDLDRTGGGLMVLHPAKGTKREGWHEGTADALWRNAPLIRELDPDVLLLASADAIYRMDYDEVVRGHLDSSAAITMVTAQVPAGEDPGRFGVVQADGERVTGYDYKPKKPKGELIATEVFAASPGPLLELLEQLAEDSDELEDLGDGVLPRLVLARPPGADRRGPGVRAGRRQAAAADQGPAHRAGSAAAHGGGGRQPARARLRRGRLRGALGALPRRRRGGGGGGARQRPASRRRRALGCGRDPGGARRRRRRGERRAGRRRRRGDPGRSR
jgi:dTDP-glucose pyrophosphorylase